MGQIVHGSLCPHPPIAVPEVGEQESERVSGTQRALRAVGKSLAKLKPDVIIAVSPHAPVFRESVAVNQIPILRGNLGQFRAPEVRFELQNDLDFGKSIMEQAKQLHVPVDILDASILLENRVTDILDHGIMVPLYFFRESGLECPVVPISISFLPLKMMYIFGAALAAAAEKSEKKVAILASGDLSHKLLPTAPGGYHPDGKIFDEKIQRAVRFMDPMVLLNLSEDLIEKAGQCGLRPLLMLMGGFDGYSVRSTIHFYEGPFGVGYLTAEFLPRSRDEKKRYLNNLQLQQEDNSYPVKLAMRSLRAYVTEKKTLPIPDDIPPELMKPAGVFVSLKNHGQLRGCMGTLAPTKPTAAHEIISNAINSATSDPRFKPVAADELDELTCSVDILGEPEPVKGFDELDPKRFGVIVRKGSRSGVLLPDLEGIDSAAEQVTIAKQKAGISPYEDCLMERFEVIRYT